MDTDPPTVVEAVQSGSRRAVLEALSARVAAELHSAVGRDTANLSRELRALQGELESIPTGRIESRLDQLAQDVGDELAQRRANREPRAAN